MDPTVRNQTQPSSSSSSSDTSFPILAISILGILTTVILLVSYYVFVVKCCMTWRRADGLRRFRPRHGPDGQPTRTPFFADEESRGLEESAIRSIPTVRFRRGDHRPPHECAVCLTEFREAETLRLLPGCSHSFHVDCIDTWLQSSANCPLCRSDVAAAANHHQLSARMIYLDATNEQIAIEVREEMEEASARAKSTGAKKKKRVVRHGASMGDECIDVRCSMDSEQLRGVQPMRRSFSMDSSCDRRLYQSVQEILRRAQQLQLQDRDGEGSSSGGGGSAKTRLSFFSFGHGRSSRSAVIPVQNEL